MKFDKLRGLKNNVFSTKLVRVEDDDQDCKVKEALLEDDFGYVEVQIGGRFEGVVTPDGVDTSSETLEGKKSSEILAFALPSSKVQLTIGKEISFTCDANKEVSRIFNEIQVPALKIAETVEIKPTEPARPIHLIINFSWEIRARPQVMFKKNINQIPM